MSDQSDVFSKNMDMWEKFANANMDLMFKTMEQALEGSQAFQRQINKSVNTAVTAQFDMLLGSVKSMERQLTTLSEKVDSLIEASKN